MQLSPSPGLPALRSRLRSAACVLLAASSPAVARAQAGGPGWQLDGAALLYAERSRTQIVEPVARITRLFPSGQSLSAQLSLDAMTGASPTGAQPSGRVQTTTSASGSTRTSTANAIPTVPFRDFRGALDLQWTRPAGPLSFSTGGHASRERDYQSLGASEQVSLETQQRLTTVTLGLGLNRDRVLPVHGIPVGMTGTGAIEPGRERTKQVTDGLLGISRVLTRRWMMSLNGSRTHESGYLSEPYKRISLIDAEGFPSADSTLAENRPRTRNRNSVLTGSVLHLSPDVLYASYRYYWDDWGVRSHTVDLQLRHELAGSTWMLPHLRYYRQTAADFFSYGLPLATAPQARPRDATSDLRLGPLRSLTLGMTYGLRWPGVPGEWTVRGEYLRQWGDGHPASAIGAQRRLDLFPGEDVMLFTVGCSLPL